MNHLIQEAKLMQLKAGLITEDEYHESVTNLSEEVKPKTAKAEDLQFILRDLSNAYGQDVSDDRIKDDFKNYTVGQIKDDWINLKKGVREGEDIISEADNDTVKDLPTLKIYLKNLGTSKIPMTLDPKESIELYNYINQYIQKGSKGSISGIGKMTNTNFSRSTKSVKA